MYMAREWEGEVMSKIKCFRKGVVKVLNIILDAKTSQNDYTRNTRRPIQVFLKERCMAVPGILSTLVLFAFGDKKARYIQHQKPGDGVCNFAMDLPYHF